MSGSGGPSDVLRQQTPHVLAALLRRWPDFDACEDAVQETLLAASRQWPGSGLPDDPRAWLIRVASRRMIDARRRDEARARRETVAALAEPVDAGASHDRASEGAGDGSDDTLRMLLLCAEPALSDRSRVALLLRAVAGLTTAQIAAALLVPEATMAQRISRAKATLRQAGGSLAPPTHADLPDRLHAVRHALYLAFTEGHTQSAGAALLDVALADEAIRLTERLHAALPGDGETTGLLALMLLSHARSPARTDAHGDLIPLDVQDRGLWIGALMQRGTDLVERSLSSGPAGPFQIQAAIAAVHAEARQAGDTDWLQIVVLYRMLDRLAPSPTVSLNLAVAIGMAHGADHGLAALEPLLASPDLQRNHRLHAAHAHLLDLSGDRESAIAAYRRAASLTHSLPEQRYLNRRASP